MKLPRNINADELITLLKPLGYIVTRQVGSHIRLTRNIDPQHHITIPNHNPIRVGTLPAILGDVALHLKMSKDELARKIFT